MSSKQEQRTKNLNDRLQMPHHEVVRASLKALGYLKPLLPKDEWVGLYAPIKNELDPSLLFNQWSCLPSIENQQLVFRAYQEPLIQGEFGTWVSTGMIVTPRVIVVPGIGFDASGYRIGYGKAYYDRYLTKDHCKIGLVHHTLMVEEINHEDHDVAMNIIVTDQGIIEVNPCIR